MIIRQLEKLNTLFCVYYIVNVGSLRFLYKIEVVLDLASHNSLPQNNYVNIKRI